MTRSKTIRKIVEPGNAFDRRERQRFTAHNDRFSCKQSVQLGFDTLLATAEADNAARRYYKKTAHLPETLAEAILFHRDQIKQHHAAMLDGDFAAALAIRKEAHLLARKLDTKKRGILAGDGAPGNVLAQTCAAEPGMPPLWGQAGRFELHAAQMEIAITLHRMFSIGARFGDWLGFEARALHPDRPFLSGTGYRSFLGVSMPRETGVTPTDFVRRIIETFVSHDLRGRLVRIEQPRTSP